MKILRNRVEALENCEQTTAGDPALGRAEQMRRIRDRRLSMTPAEQAAERSSQMAVAIEALTQPDAPAGTDEQRVQVMSRSRASRHMAAMLQRFPVVKP